MLFIDGIQDLLPSLKDFIQSKVDAKDEYVITTRLDNDDAVHLEFVDTIQKIAYNNGEAVIDLLKGYQLNLLNKKFECRSFTYRFNPFISVVEKATDFQTVYSRMHPAWKNYSSIVSYDKKPLWIEVIHANNKLNDVRANFPLVLKTDFTDFGIHIEKENLPYTSIHAKNLSLILNRICSRIRLKFYAVLSKIF